jgi:hypothetical protein
MNGLPLESALLLKVCYPFYKSFPRDEKLSVLMSDLHQNGFSVDD